MELCKKLPPIVDTVQLEMSSNSKKRSHEASRSMNTSDGGSAPKRPGLRSHHVSMDANTSATPRSLLEAFVHTHGTVQQTEAKRQSTRSSSNVTKAPTPNQTSTRRSTRRSLNTSLQKQVALRNLTSHNQSVRKLTPRGLIAGYIAQAAESTPLVSSHSATSVVPNTPFTSHQTLVSSTSDNHSMLEDTFLSHYPSQPTSQTTQPSQRFRQPRKRLRNTRLATTETSFKGLNPEELLSLSDSTIEVIPDSMPELHSQAAIDTTLVLSSSSDQSSFDDTFLKHYASQPSSQSSQPSQRFSQPRKRHVLSQKGPLTGRQDESRMLESVMEEMEREKDEEDADDHISTQNPQHMSSFILDSLQDSTNISQHNTTQGPDMMQADEAEQRTGMTEMQADLEEIQTEESGSMTNEGGSQTDEGGSMADEEGSPNEDEYSQTNERGSKADEGGSMADEGGSPNEDEDSQTNEGGSQTDEGGSMADEEGSPKEDEYSQTNERGSKADEGGSIIDEEGSPNEDEDSQTDEGRSQTDEGLSQGTDESQVFGPGEVTKINETITVVKHAAITAPREYIQDAESSLLGRKRSRSSQDVVSLKGDTLSAENQSWSSKGHQSIDAGLSLPGEGMTKGRDETARVSNIMSMTNRSHLSLPRDSTIQRNITPPAMISGDNRQLDISLTKENMMSVSHHQSMNADASHTIHTQSRLSVGQNTNPIARLSRSRHIADGSRVDPIVSDDNGINEDISQHQPQVDAGTDDKENLSATKENVDSEEETEDEGSDEGSHGNVSDDDDDDDAVDEASGEEDEPSEAYNPGSTGTSSTTINRTSFSHDSFGRLARTPILPPHQSPAPQVFIPDLRPSPLVPQTLPVQNRPGRPAATRSRTGKKSSRLPSSLTRSIFSHFSQRKLSKPALEELEKVADEYWKNVTSDLDAYTRHARRRIVDESDVELLMKRQGFVTPQVSMFSLVEKHLPMEYRRQIIPIARADNKIIPKP